MGGTVARYSRAIELRKVCMLFMCTWQRHVRRDTLGGTNEEAAAVGNKLNAIFYSKRTTT